MDRALESRRELVTPLAKWLLTGALAIVAAYHLARVFDLGHKSYGEGPILALTERMETEAVSGGWRTGPPYTLSCYGPAYYWVSDALAQLGGWRHSMIPGRLVSVAAALVVAALIAVAAGRRVPSDSDEPRSQARSGKLRHTECAYYYGALGALMFLVSAPVTEWLPYARVDMLALAGAALAYVAIDRRWGGMWLPAMAVVAGSLAKPTAALAAVPIVIHLWACRRRGHAIQFGLLVAALGALAWGLVECTSGGYFLSAVLSGNRNPMSLWRGYRFGYEFLASPLGVAACITVVRLWIVSPERFRRSLFSLGFVVSLMISTVLVCKRGSDLNYFLEPAMLASLAIAIDGLPGLYQVDRRRATIAGLLLTIVLLVPVLRELRASNVARQFLARAERGESHRPTSGDVAEHYAAVSRYLAYQPDDIGILADGHCVDMVLAAGRRPWVNDSYLYMLLTANGTLDASELIEQAREGRIAWLFLHDSLETHQRAVDRQANLWPPEVLRCLAENFQRLPAPAGLYVYQFEKRAGGSPTRKRGT